jgi:hypothetical protein
MGWMDAPEVGTPPKWAAATEVDLPQYAPNGVPMNAAARAELIARAKGGEIAQPSPRQAGIDLDAEKALVDRGPVHAMVQGATQGATFGFGDEIVAGGLSLLPGMTYDQALTGARGELDAARFTRPGTTMAAEIGGAVALPLGSFKTTGKLGMDVLRGAGTGAALSGAYGFGASKGGLQERANDALVAGGIGGFIGGMIPGIGAGVQAVQRNRATRKAIADAVRGAPTTEQLRAAGNAAYRAVDDMGVSIKPEAFGAVSDDLVAGMRAKGLDEGIGSLTPQSERLATILRGAGQADQPIPFSEIDLIRRKAGVPAANMAVKTESALGTGVIEGLDDFVRNLTPEQVAAGNAEGLSGAITKAREVWSRMSKSQMIDDAMDASGNYLSGEASGLRNQFARILRNPKLSRGFTDLEKSAMRKAINGTLPEKMLNLIGGGMGQLGAIGSGAGIGSMLGGPLGTVLGTVAGAGIGAAARKGSEAVAGRNAEIVRALVASGKAAALPAISETPRAAIERLLQRGTAAGLQQ